MVNCHICTRDETILWFMGEMFHKVKLENIKTKEEIVTLVCSTCLHKIESRELQKKEGVRV